MLLGGRKETLRSGSRHVRRVSPVVTGEGYCHLNFMFQHGDVWIQFQIRQVLSGYYLVLVILNLPGLGVFFCYIRGDCSKGVFLYT